MKLERYLEKRELSQAAFAELFSPKVTQGAVSHWITGTARVEAERALEIERITKGEVSRHDMRPDLWPRTSAA
jgi:DNA-binding transcriptional regulator YdaS (Cro superfamily)